MLHIYEKILEDFLNKVQIKGHPECAVDYFCFNYGNFQETHLHILSFAVINANMQNIEHHLRLSSFTKEISVAKKMFRKYWLYFRPIRSLIGSGSSLLEK